MHRPDIDIKEVDFNGRRIQEFANDLRDHASTCERRRLGSQGQQQFRTAPADVIDKSFAVTMHRPALAKELLWFRPWLDSKLFACDLLVSLNVVPHGAPTLPAPGGVSQEIGHHVEQEDMGAVKAERFQVVCVEVLARLRTGFERSSLDLK